MTAGWILEITVALVMVTNIQVTQSPCTGLKRKILRQNWGKGVRVVQDCIACTSSLNLRWETRVR